MNNSERLDQIRRSHASARPKPWDNPSWANAHNDLTFVLAELDRQLLRLEHSETACGAAERELDATLLRLDKEQKNVDGLLTKLAELSDKLTSSERRLDGFARIAREWQLNERSDKATCVRLLNAVGDYMASAGREYPAPSAPSEEMCRREHSWRSSTFEEYTSPYWVCVGCGKAEPKKHDEWYSHTRLVETVAPSEGEKDYSLYARLGRGQVNYEDFRTAFTQGWVHATADRQRGMRTAEEVGEAYRQLYEKGRSEGEKPDDPAQLVREIVAWFEVLASKYGDGLTPGDEPRDPEWPKDWLRRARATLVEKQRI